MTYDYDESFTSAAEFLACLLEADVFQPRRLFDVCQPGSCGYIFRGQRDKDQRLIPLAHRDPEILRSFAPQPPDRKELARGQAVKYLGTYLNAELQAVFGFLEQADRLGIETPLDYATFRLHSQLLSDAIQKGNIDPTAEFPDQRVLPSMALAQHHRVPTRLLDWTESQLVAAYFAAEQASCLGKDSPESEFAVFCLNTWILTSVNGLRTVSAPRHINSFLRAQKGLFTVIPTANRFFLEHQRWPSVEDVIAAERNPDAEFKKPPLLRIALVSSEADELLRLLFRYEITRHHLMPSLSNAAQALSYKRALWPR